VTVLKGAIAINYPLIVEEEGLCCTLATVPSFLVCFQIITPPPRPPMMVANFPVPGKKYRKCDARGRNS
jgi:hypothetical protein